MKYYAVKNGRKTGIFTDWSECRESVNGYSGAEYKSFLTESEAEAYLNGGEPTGFSGITAYVDGSFNEKTSEFSYGAVIIDGDGIKTFSEKFSDSELSSMRNVAGEIKGAEFVMKYCLENGITAVRLIYDYEGIAKWALGEWKRNKIGTIAYKNYYDSIKDALFVQFDKVKSHSGNKYNDMADKLAKQALGID